MKLPDTKILINKVKKGDKQAFESIYWMYRKPVLALAQRYHKDRQLAEDAVQDVFSKLWLNREELYSEKYIKAFFQYLYIHSIRTNNIV